METVVEQIKKEPIKKVEMPIAQYRGATSHTPRSYSIKSNPYHRISAFGMITGCGLVQVYGVASINSTNFAEYKEVFDNIKSEYKDDGAGAILCTLGGDFYDKEKFILDLGFEMLREYHNYTHGPEYMQRLYCLTY